MTHAPNTPPEFRPEPDVWTRARHDYLSGISAPVVAERHGLSERTLRRRAAIEGWRRVDGPAVGLDGPSPIRQPPLTRDEAIESFPELAEAEQATMDDQFDLLLLPDQKHLRRFAFRQAAAAAALLRPAEAVVWMRLVQSLDRSGDRIEAEGRPFREEDYLRAAFLRRVEETVGAEPTDDH